MEIYSTTLWHLQKDVALSVLSKDLTDMDKNSPEVWIAVVLNEKSMNVCGKMNDLEQSSEL